MALTDAQIKALKPTAARYSKVDGNGLLLDITPGGVRSWVYRYRINGKREKLVLGRYPNMSLKAARAERDKKAALVAKGESPALERKLARVGMTPNSTVAVRSNSLTNLVSALKSGLGVGMLPCLLGDAEPDLQRCLSPIAELDSQTWLVLREDLKHSPHVRAFADFISAYVQRLRGRFAGTAPVV